MAATRRVFTLLILTLYVRESCQNFQRSSGSLDKGTLGFSGWPDYIKDWEDNNYQMSKQMYPFNENYGDTKEVKSFSQTLMEGIPFYAVNYKNLIVSLHGHVEFSEVPKDPTFEWKRVTWPNQEFPSENEEDPAFIAPLYAAHSTSKQGKIYYRAMILTSGTDPVSLINVGQLEQISDHVQEAMVGADTFQATRGLIVTWADMSFQGVSCDSNLNHDTCPRNTYQMALVTDNIDSYVVLNYYNMTWVGSPATGCSPKTGREWDQDTCTAAQIGFNVGEGRHFWPHPYSMSQKVADLDQEDFKGSTVRGRFFYRVSDAFILRGGCTNDATLAGSSWPLAVNPVAGGMLGGYDVNISAPCFSTNLIQCKFGDDVSEGVFDPDNIMKARCPAPRMASVGKVKVSVSTDGGKSYPFTNQFNVGIIGYVPAGIKVSNPTDDWLNVDMLELSWNPRALTWRTIEAIDIHLYGYKETGTSGSYTGSWRLLHTVSSASPNSGDFSVYANEVYCGGEDAEYLCMDYNVGAFQVRISNTNPGASPTALWSEPLPLGWFVKGDLTQRLGSAWAHEKCLTWHSADVRDNNWQAELAVCPCTLGQALADWGRFPQDLHCNAANMASPDNCRRHTAMQHCVRSIQYTADGGAGSHCCYDARGMLVYSADNQYGSTPDRAHSWGSPPYRSGPRVPTLSHWHWDVAPFYLCCAWQQSDYDCFNFYIARRMTKDCKSYKSPGHAAVFGDPHLLTFDGATYTFNGHGEFWLVQAESTMEGRDLQFGLQGRFQQADDMNWGTPKATILTAVAMQESGPGGTARSKVELQRNTHDPGNRRLLVYVEGDLLDFKDPNMWRQDYDDLIIMNNDPTSSKMHSNFTVIYRSSGVGVQVAYKSDFLQVITVLPPEFYKHTEGLFGNWDGSPANDIQPRNGGQGIPPDDTPRIHPVGLTWQITASESFFKYWARVNLDFYWKKDFSPVFEPVLTEDSGITASQVDSLCGNNGPCRFDYIVTRSAKLAKDALDIQAWVKEMVASAKEVPTCGWLNVPNAVKKEPIDNSPGSVVVIETCRHGFELSGPSRYQCVLTGGSSEWQPAVTTRCIDQSEAKEAEVQTAIAIGVPVGIVLIIIVIGVVALLCYLRQRRIDKGPKDKVTPDDLEHIPVSNFHASSITPEDERPTSKKKKPRPSKPGSEMTASHSYDDLAVHGNNYPSIITKKPFSASADQLDGHDDSYDGQSSQSGASTYKRPYEYPRNTETTTERRKAPYRYPRGTDNLTTEERALIEMKSRIYEDK